MDSLQTDDLEHDNPPRKRIKLSESMDSISNGQVKLTESNRPAEPGAVLVPELLDTGSSEPASKPAMSNDIDFQVVLTKAENEQMEKEIAVGIELFVSDGAGFRGVLKQRYSDFLVNEIMPNGKVARLNDPEMLRAPAAILAKHTDVEQSTASNDGSSSKTNGSNSLSTIAPLPDDGESTTNSQSTLPEPTDLHDDENPDLKSVREILAEGTKAAPASQPANLTSHNFEQLIKFFGLIQIKRLAEMYRDVTLKTHKSVEAYGSVDCGPIDDKDERKVAHQIVRTVFNGKIETAHKDGDILHCTVASSALSRKGQANSRSRNNRNPQPSWKDLGGDYLHFSLYKENRDANDVLGYLASKIGLRNIKTFDTAGIKDRRAATVQRISAYRITSERLLKLNNTINQSRVGDCSYHKDKLQLGDLAGNEFVITLRDCAVRIPDSDFTTIIPDEVDQYITKGMVDLREKGFLNYYGLQRFGSFATRTDEVGQYMINGDLKAAVETILEVSASTLAAIEAENGGSKVSQDDKRRAQALHWFKNKSTDTKKILETLPRRFAAEYAIVKFLCNEDDQATPYYRGALEAIPRGTRLLYGHAYQSFIWNSAATYRWRLSPGKLMPGDLVLAHRAPKANPTFTTTKYDAQGEPIFEPGQEHNDRIAIHEQYEGNEAYALTAADIASGRYSIFDIVLPQPGFQVQYPTFMLDFYKTTMAARGGIDPQNMRRNWRDVSLPGTYRKLLGRPFEAWGFEQIWYDGAETQIALTDLDVLKLKEERAQAGAARKSPSPVSPSQATETPSFKINLADNIPTGKRLAIVLKFQLPSSTYATMALRELMKPGPIEFKPEFSEGR